MPPKKRPRRGQNTKAKAAAVSASAKLKTVQPKSTSAKAKASTATVNKRSKYSTKGSKTLEAAAGAGIRTTDELQNYMHSVRNPDANEAVALGVTDQENNEFPDDIPPVQQTSNNATPEDDIDNTSSSSESDLDSVDTCESEDEGESGPTPPVKRKLPFNRRTKEFDRVEISPGSLENGRDTRELEKLQEILLANPGAVSAIDSMLKLMKTNRTDANETSAEKQTAQDNPPSGSGVRRGPVQGTSETTIYTRAVPSASPSQEVRVGQAVQMDRLAMSLNAVAMQPLPSVGISDGNEPLGANLELSSQEVHPDNVQATNVPCESIVEPITEESARRRSNRQADEIHLERVAAKTRTDVMVVEAERQKLALALDR